MAFNPNNPAKPQDLYAVFDTNNLLNGLIYNSPQGAYARNDGEWIPLAGAANPFGSGGMIVFVDPSFIDDYDAYTMRRIYPAYKDIYDKYRVEPEFDIKP